ncbi:putative C2H2 finger domain protein [Lipomyces mesembrius]
MDRSPLSIALTRRHHSESALTFAPLPLHPKPAVHALPDFRLAPRSYSPASLDAYHLRSSAPSFSFSSSVSTTTSSTASTPPVARSPASSPPSSDRALPPISSILAGSVEAAAGAAAATLAYCAAVSRDRARSWPTQLPAVQQQPQASPSSAPTPILSKDTPSSSLANSPALSSVFSVAGSPYSVASDLPPSSSSSLSDCAHPGYHYSSTEPEGCFSKRPTSPTPTAASEGYHVLSQTDVTIDGRAAYSSCYPVPKVTPSTSPSLQQHSDSTSPSASTSADRYVCQICSRAFSRPSSLRIHSHSHTGEKPFVCGHQGCGKAFSVRSNMKRHERGCHAL